jgi:hypothetical protein
MSQQISSVHFALGIVQHRKLVLALAGASFCEEQAPVQKSVNLSFAAP